MILRNRHRKTLFGKRLACLVLLLVTAATCKAGEDRIVHAMPASQVWVPAEAVQPEAMGYDEPGVRLAEHEESITPEAVRPAPRLTDAVSDPNASVPGLIVPIEEAGPALQAPLPYDTLMPGDPGSGTIVTDETILPYGMTPDGSMISDGSMVPGGVVMPGNTVVSGGGMMVPGSLRVLPMSDSMPVASSEPWQFQILPSGVVWRSYLAGPREPRISSTFFRVRKEQNFWDATVGGRVALMRWGTGDKNSPEGVELQIEGAAFPRLTLDYERDVVSSDFRFGFPLVYRRGAIEGKFSYYHLSSHLGDEYILSHPGSINNRINFSRDAMTLAIGFYPWRDLRLYSEADYAVWCDGGSRPWAFQFGADYSPARPTGVWGAPFLAVNGHLRQELNYSGGLTAQAGVQWRGQNGRLFRTGFQYFNGMSENYQFHQQFEQQIGGGIWYDF